MQITCEFDDCRKRFEPTRSDARYCSDLCRTRAHKARQGHQDPKTAEPVRTIQNGVQRLALSSRELSPTPPQASRGLLLEKGISEKEQPALHYDVAPDVRSQLEMNAVKHQLSGLGERMAVMEEKLNLRPSTEKILEAIRGETAPLGQRLTEMSARMTQNPEFKQLSIRVSRLENAIESLAKEPPRGKWHDELREMTENHENLLEAVIARLKQHSDAILELREE